MNPFVPPISEIEFTRSRKKLAELPLTAMIDVVFILIFFFMLTTSFMRIESMELLLPTVSTAKPAKHVELARIILHNDGTLSFGQRQVDRDELELTLKVLFQNKADQQVVVYADTEVSMQELVEVMDMVTVTGGKSLYVRPLPKDGD